MKTAAVMAMITSAGALGGGVTDVGYLALAGVLVVAIVAVSLMLRQGIAPQIEWGPFKFSFRRLPRAGGPKQPD